MPQFDLNDYVDTQARINKFWTERASMDELGFITTEVLTDADNDSFVTIRATVGIYKTLGSNTALLERVVLATGIASEVRTYATERGGPGHNRVNESSWVENCETSAIGRALANFGYATTGAERPSQEEMAKVNAYEDSTKDTRPDPQRQTSGYRQPAQRQQQGGAPVIQNPDAAPTDKQIKLIMDMAKGKEQDIAYAMFEVPFDQLTRQQASDIIGELMNARPAKPEPTAQQEVLIVQDKDHTF